MHEVAHKDLQQLFPRQIAITHSYGTKFQAHRHGLQLKEQREGTKHALLRRSIFGLTRVWNRLPQEVIGADSVTAMQRSLTAMVRTACRVNVFDWAKSLSPRPVLLHEPLHFKRLYMDPKCFNVKHVLLLDHVAVN